MGETIKDVKTEIQKLKGVLPGNRLMLGDQELKDEEDVSDYDIEDGSTILLEERLIQVNLRNSRTGESKEFIFDREKTIREAKNQFNSQWGVPLQHGLEFVGTGTRRQPVRSRKTRELSALLRREKAIQLEDNKRLHEYRQIVNGSKIRVRY